MAVGCERTPRYRTVIMPSAAVLALALAIVVNAQETTITTTTDTTTTETFAAELAEEATPAAGAV